MTPDRPGEQAHGRSVLQAGRKICGRGFCGGAFGLLVLCAGFVPALAADPLLSAEECLACHSDRELSKPGPAGRPISLFVDQDAFQGSVHAILECVQCHTVVTAVLHRESLNTVECRTCHELAVSGVHTRLGKGRASCSTCHGSHAIRSIQQGDSAICKTCHAGVVRTYGGSVHGLALARGEREVASCRNCHGSAHDLKSVRDPVSPVYPLNLPRTCATCHGDPELAKRHGIPVVNAYELYMDSIHGRALAKSGLLVAANCSSCHGFHDIRPKADPASKVYRGNVPSTCGACHAGALTDYTDSVHGRAVQEGKLAAPVCINCHTAHQIARVETAAWKLEIVRECGTCHGESLRTYRDSFHGQVTALGFTRVARCSDCHGSHRILPASDPDSSITSSNLVKTCRKCHPRANENFVQFSPHADPKDKGRNPGLYYAARFMNVLMVGVFAFFGIHTSLWLTRSMIELGRTPRSPAEPPDESGREDDEEGGGPRND